MDQTVDSRVSVERVDEMLYEYACHEGNYALGDILRGERLLDREAAAARKTR